MQNDEPPGRPGPASTGPRQVFWTQWQEIELAFSIRERFQECDSVVSLTNYVEIDPLYLTAIILPSLRPHLLSRVVGCLWSTVIYRVLVLQNNLRSHLLWLCESAESDLITSVARDWFPSHLHLYYTTFLRICQYFFEKFLLFF